MSGAENEDVRKRWQRDQGWQRPRMAETKDGRDQGWQRPRMAGRERVAMDANGWQAERGWQRQRMAEAENGRESDLENRREFENGRW